MSTPSFATPDYTRDVASLSGSKPDVLVKIGSCTYKAHSDLLRKFSSLANGMPEPFTKWDLDLLEVFDGKPPTATVVETWLKTLYWHKDSPCSLKTLQEALPVLRFADAVGSPPCMLHTIANNVADWAVSWALDVPYGSSGTPPLALPLVGNEVYVLQIVSAYHFSMNRCYQLCKVDMSEYIRAGRTLVNLKEGTQYTVLLKTDQHYYDNALKQIIEQLEELLFMAMKLQFKKLAVACQNFVRRQRVSGAEDGILYHDANIKKVISGRVQQAVLGNPEASQQGWLKWVTGDDSCV